METNKNNRAQHFSLALAIQHGMELALKTATRELQELGAGSGLLGITPDAVKASVPYKIAKLKSVMALAELQRFNSDFTREYAKELKRDREERRAAK